VLVAEWVKDFWHFWGLQRGAFGFVRALVGQRRARWHILTVKKGENGGFFWGFSGFWGGSVIKGLEKFISNRSLFFYFFVAFWLIFGYNV